MSTTSTVQPSVTRQPLADQVRRDLEARLESGEFPLGARLPSEADLMTLFGVGRSTIREAIRSLAHLGVLDVRQGDGTYARSLPSQTDPLSNRLRRAHLRDVYAVRRLLEVEINRLAAIHRTPADIERLTETLAREDHARAANDEPARAAAAVDFHLALVAAAHNPVLADLYRTFTGVLRQSVLTDPANHSVAEGCDGGFHHTLFATVASGDGAAAAAMTSHGLGLIEQSLIEESPQNSAHPSQPAAERSVALSLGETP